jgi:hypothetical protein
MKTWRGIKPLGQGSAASAADLQRAIATGTSETELQASIAEALEFALPRDCFWTAIPGGDGRATRTPGYRSGTPDLLFIYRGLPLFIEMKRPRGGVVSAAQRDVHPLIEAAGGRVYTARALEHVVELIRDELQCPVNLRLP